MRQAASIGSRCTLSHLARLRALARAAAQPVTVSAFRTPPTSFQVALGPGHCQADPPQWFVDGYVIHVARCCSTGRGGCVACTDDRRKRLPMCVCVCVCGSSSEETSRLPRQRHLLLSDIPCSAELSQSAHYLPGRHRHMLLLVVLRARADYSPTIGSGRTNTIRNRTTAGTCAC